MQEFVRPNLRVNVEEDVPTGGQVTPSGSYQVGNIFRINSEGYEFNESDLSIYTHIYTPSHLTPTTRTPSSSISRSESRLNLITSSSGQNRVDPAFEIKSLADVTKGTFIGQGASGSVQSAYHTATQTSLALKVVPVDCSSESKASKSIVTELRTLHSSNSPFIIGFHGAFYSEQSITLVLEHMDIGSLSDLNKRRADRKMPEPIIAKVIAQVLLGLDYLHTNRKLIHRDIKPSNILINSKGRVKLADFGVSGQTDNDTQERHSVAGTYVYMSPERIEGKNHSFDSDIWSLGLTIVEMALGTFPYQLRNNRQAPLAPLVPHTPTSTTSMLSVSNLSGSSSTSSSSSSSSIPSPLFSNSVSPQTPSPVSNSELYNATQTTERTPSRLGNLPAADPLQRSVSISFWEIRQIIVTSPCPSLSSDTFSPELVNFVRICMEKEPSKRPTAAALLKHPFIVKHINVADPNTLDTDDLATWIKNETAPAANPLKRRMHDEVLNSHSKAKRRLHTEASPSDQNCEADFLAKRVKSIPINSPAEHKPSEIFKFPSFNPIPFSSLSTSQFNVSRDSFLLSSAQNLDCLKMLSPTHRVKMLSPTQSHTHTHTHTHIHHMKIPLARSSRNPALQMSMRAPSSTV